MITDFLTETLEQLAQKGLKRRLRQVTGTQSREITIDGKKVLNFCSNNYLGLADDPRLSEAAAKALKEEGFGSGASRLVCGNLSSHTQLEQKIAAFKGTEAALLFSTGYMANVGIIPAVCGHGDLIFSDRLNHASIIDGILLSHAEFKRYPHNDTDILEVMLKAAPAEGKKLIITDSVFSMDGDVAPLDKIVTLAEKYNCMVMIDEAHGFGVLGKKGKGAAEHFGVEDKIDIQMGTFSKAAGSFGGYVAGKKVMIDLLINRARSFIYTTGLPPAVAAATVRAIEIIEREPELREKLWNNTRFLLSEIQKLGFDTLNSTTPIIPILIKDNELCLQFSQKLFEAGIFVSAIRPPTVPVNTSRLRVTVTAAHTQQDLEKLLMHLKTIGKELCLI